MHTVKKISEIAGQATILPRQRDHVFSGQKMVDHCIISKFVLHLDTEASFTFFVIFLVTEALL